MSTDDDRRVLDLPASQRPNLGRPRWDQSTYAGRARYFFTTTNPLNLFAGEQQLNEAKRIVEDYTVHDKVSDARLTVEQLWQAKHLFDSAYHPETHEKMLIVGRMSAQVPMNMVITGCMMTFYKTTPAVVFWQWFNQSFNAVVNYTNRSGSNPIGVDQLGKSYVLATTGALATALSLNAAVKVRAFFLVGGHPQTVCIVNATDHRSFCTDCGCVSSEFHQYSNDAKAVSGGGVRSFTREWPYSELDDGITVLDESGKPLGESRIAARTAITQVVASRIGMAMPGMTLTPFLMNWLDKKTWWKPRAALLSAPLQTALIGVILTFATPMCCALFPQMSSIDVTKLEPELQTKINAQPNPPKIVYYNKGL